MAKRFPALSWINWIDMPLATDTTPGVVFTPSAEILTLPAKNLADEDMGIVWGVSGLTGGATSFFCDIDLGADCEIGVLGFVAGWRLDTPLKLRATPMMAATDKIRFYLDDSATAFGTGGLGGSGLVDCNINPHKGYHVWIPTTPVANVRKIRLYVDAISRATLGYWWGARLWAGPIKKMIRGHQFGHIDRWDLNAFEETVRRPSVPFQRVKSAELDAMTQFEQLTVTKRQLLFIEDVNNPHESSLIGKRPETTGFQSSFFQNYGYTLQMEESW